ncbi:hypothetical protein MHYP_G00350130 [Metynnis hypsauchen]
MTAVWMEHISGVESITVGHQVSLAPQWHSGGSCRNLLSAHVHTGSGERQLRDTAVDCRRPNEENERTRETRE